MGRKLAGDPAKTFSGQALKAVAVDGSSEIFFRNHDSESRVFAVVDSMSNEKKGGGNFFAGREQIAESFLFTKPKGSGKFFASRTFGFADATQSHFLYAVFAKRLRPLARRRFSTFCPAVVSLRLRKPCLRFALILLGWNVLFIAMTSSLLAAE